MRQQVLAREEGSFSRKFMRGSKAMSTWRYTLLTVGLAMAGLLTAGCMDTVYVDADASGPGIGTPEAPFQSITTGLYWAASGATVYVAPGDYSENLVISRPVTLLGAGAGVTRILADVTHMGVEIDADNVEIRGFSIVGVGEPDPEKYFGGITAEDVSNLTISDNVVGPYPVIGIGVAGASNVVIENNQVLEISGNQLTAGYGIYLLLVKSSVITGNAVSNTDGFGLCVNESAADLEMNTVANCSFGLRVFASNIADAEVSLRDNTIEGSLHAAMDIYLSTIAEFYDNTIVNNPGIGLEIYDEETVILECGGNVISGNNPDFGEYLQYYGQLDQVLPCLG